MFFLSRRRTSRGHFYNIVLFLTCNTCTTDDRETFKEVLYFIILLRKPYTRMNWMNLLPEIWDRTSLGTKDSPVLVIKACLTVYHFGRTTCSSANIDLIYNLQSLCFSKRGFRNLFLIVFPLFQIVVNLQVISVALRFSAGS